MIRMTDYKAMMSNYKSIIDLTIFSSFSFPFSFVFLSVDTTYIQTLLYYTYILSLVISQTFPLNFFCFLVLFCFSFSFLFLLFFGLFCVCVHVCGDTCHDTHIWPTIHTFFCTNFVFLQIHFLYISDNPLFPRSLWQSLWQLLFDKWSGKSCHVYIWQLKSFGALWHYLDCVIPIVSNSVCDCQIDCQIVFVTVK